jgi:hypothetical protein
LISGILEAIVIFFLSFVRLSQPSDSLTRDDIENIRRGRQSENNGNDYRYKGKRGNYLFILGNCKLPMGGWGWAILVEEGTEISMINFQ